MIGLAATRGDASITEARVFDLEEHRRRREMRNERWVCPKDVAAHFGISRSTVYRWAATPGCPTKHLPGGTLRFQISAVSGWLDSQR